MGPCIFRRQCPFVQQVIQIIRIGEAVLFGKAPHLIAAADGGKFPLDTVPFSGQLFFFGCQQIPFLPQSGEGIFRRGGPGGGRGRVLLCHILLLSW